MPEVKDRRSDILNASAKLFAAQGVAGTSMREIGDEVGINAGALYHYFRSKNAIVNELITNYLSDLFAAYEAKNLDQLEPRARLRAIVDVSLETGSARPDETKVYRAEFPNLRDAPDYARARTLADSIQNIWLEAIDDGKVAGVLRKEIPTRVFHLFLRDAVWLTTYWHRPDGPYRIENLADDCISIFLDGMAV